MELEDNFRSANDELEKKEEEIYQLHKVLYTFTNEVVSASKLFLHNRASSSI